MIGLGVKGIIDEKHVAVGSKKLMQSINAKNTFDDQAYIGKGYTIFYTSIDLEVKKYDRHLRSIKTRC